ncbi:MAG: hypothetical protein SGPRY_002197 [Prymnesium sp.]
MTPANSTDSQTLRIREYFAQLLEHAQKTGDHFLNHFNIAATLSAPPLLPSPFDASHAHTTPTAAAPRAHLSVRSAQEASIWFDRGSVCFSLKVIKKSDVLRQDQVDHIKNEREILQEICHPFIANMYIAFQDHDQLYMLSEFVNGGELFTHLRSMGKFSNAHARHYAGQIVLVLD